MDWFYDKQVDILSETGGELVHGIWVDGQLTLLKTIDCDMQPYSKEKAYQDYGFSFECTKRMFCNPIELSDDAIVRYDGELFSIQKRVAWDDYYDIMLVDYKGKAGD